MMEKTENIIQSLSKLDISRSLQIKLQQLKTDLGYIKTSMDEDDKQLQKYFDSYFPKTQKILQDIKDNLEIQNKAKYYNPSALPAPYQQIISCLNQSKEVNQKIISQKQVLKKCRDNITKSKKEFDSVEKQHVEDLAQIQEQIQLTQKKIDQKKKDIYESESIKNTTQYQSFVAEHIKLLLEIEETKKNIDKITQRQIQLGDQRKKLEEDLTQIRKIQDQNGLKLKEIQCDYNNQKKKLQQIQQRHREEIQDQFNQLNQINDKIQSTIQTITSKNILLVDQNQKDQYQEDSLKVYLESIKDSRDFQYHSYQSQDRFNLSNITLTYKFHPPKLFSSFQKSIEDSINGQKNNTNQDMNLIIIGNSQDYNLQSSSYQRFLQEICALLKIQKHKLQIFIFDKCNSKQSLYRDLSDSLKQSNFNAKFFIDFNSFLTEIKNCQKLDNQSIRQQQNIDYSKSTDLNQQSINILQLEQNIKMKKEEENFSVNKQNQVQENLEQLNEDFQEQEKQLRQEKQKQDEQKQEILLLENKMAFYVKEQQVLQADSNLTPLQKELAELEKQEKCLQLQNLIINKLIPQMINIENVIKRKLEDMDHYIESTTKEIKKLFSILWILKGQSCDLIVLFALLLQEQNKFFDELPEKNLSEILKVDDSVSKQFNQKISFHLTQNEKTKRLEAAISWKQSSQHQQFQNLFDKLNLLLIKEVINIINEIQTYSNFNELNLALINYIKDLS